VRHYDAASLFLGREVAHAEAQPHLSRAKFWSRSTRSYLKVQYINAGYLVGIDSSEDYMYTVMHRP
jgi:hypothetical protein